MQSYVLAMNPMKKDLSVYQRDIVRSCTTIEKYIGEKTKEDFDNDEELHDTVIRRLEIIEGFKITSPRFP